MSVLAITRTRSKNPATKPTMVTGSSYHSMPPSSSAMSMKYFVEVLLWYILYIGYAVNVRQKTFSSVWPLRSIIALQSNDQCLYFDERFQFEMFVSNLFYNFVSLPSFLYFLFTFNIVYTASHHRIMSLLWWRTSVWNVSNLYKHKIRHHSTTDNHF